MCIVEYFGRGMAEKQPLRIVTKIYEVVTTIKTKGGTKYCTTVMSSKII